MDYKRLMRVVKKTRAVVEGKEELGLLVTGQDPLVLSDMDLVSFIQNAGIEDVDEVFDSMGLNITHGSLAAMAFAASQISDEQSSCVASSTSTTHPLAGPNTSSFIGQNQQQIPPPPGAPNQMMMSPQMIQGIAEAVKASLVNDGWTAPGQVSQPTAGGALGSSGKDADMVVDDKVVIEASVSEAARCVVHDRNDIPMTVGIPHRIIERIFAGSPAEVARIIQSSSIKDKQDISGGSGADIEYTLRYLKVENFSISDTPLNIDVLKASTGSSYTLTIPRIDFKVKGEFKYKMRVFGLGPKGTGSFDVVGRNWAVKMDFRFDAERDGGVILNMVNCHCSQDDVELVNLDCSVPELMKVFSHTPRNYIADEMKLKLVDTFQSVIHKSAKEVLKTVRYQGTRDELLMKKMYPGMEEDCILGVCNTTFKVADLREKLMTIDPNVVHLLPDNVISSSAKEAITKTDWHHPTIQARGTFITALQESIEPTKVVRQLAVLDKEQSRLAKKIEDIHKEEIRKHKASCHKCSTN